LKDSWQTPAALGSPYAAESVIWDALSANTNKKESPNYNCRARHRYAALQPQMLIHDRGSIMDLGYLYTSFNGRINRQPYWLGTLIIVIPVIVIVFVIAASMGESVTAPSFRARLISLVIELVLLYPASALIVKRLHDRNRPGGIAAIFLAPSLIKAVTDLAGVTGNPLAPNILDLLLGLISFGIGIWALVEIGCLPGTAGPNQYGPDPLLASRG
jgi:uncharacterized membrane protein YhaH (DUF805 family)